MQFLFISPTRHRAQLTAVRSNSFLFLQKLPSNCDSNTMPSLIISTLARFAAWTFRSHSQHRLALAFYDMAVPWSSPGLEKGAIYVIHWDNHPFRQQINNHIFLNSCTGSSVNHYEVLSILWLHLVSPWHWHHHAETAKI